jgi:hypothetical protein
MKCIAFTSLTFLDADAESSVFDREPEGGFWKKFEIWPRALD